MKKQSLVQAFVFVAICSSSTLAQAGGFYAPANGAEIAGRGGAFVAKADNPMAIEYNVAGIARMRGTHLLIDVNLHFHDYSFQRAGNYPSPEGGMGMAEPWSGMPYPRVSNSGAPFLAPMLAITTDFNKFDRWTFGFAIHGPSSVGNRSFVNPLPDGRPNPARYDVVEEGLLIIKPTLAAAVRATKWLDIGVGLQIVIGHFNLENISFADLGRALCPNLETTVCDSKTKIVTDGVSATFSFGMQARPVRWISLGASIEGPTTLNTTGTVTATAPSANPLVLDPSPAEFHTRLPWILRLGARYVFWNKDDREAGDIELNGIYEAWSTAQGTGDQINIPNLGPFSDINPQLYHRYKDTGSVRLGGAYNLYLKRATLKFRLGTFWESAATKPKFTRLDFDTEMHVGGTAGFGFTVRGVTVNLAYLYSWSPDRTVTDGAVLPINGTNGNTNDYRGLPFPAVNNGTYEASRQMISLGVVLAWEDMLNHRTRVVRY